MAGLAGSMILLAACTTGTPATDPASSSPMHTRTPIADDAASAPGSPEAHIPAQESPGRATSDRKLPLYSPGETVKLEGADGEPVISLTITSLSVQDTCPVDGGKPSNDAFALVEVEATFEKSADAGTQQRPLLLSTEAWSYYPVEGPGYDGELGSAAAASCQQAGNALPAELKPGSSVRGTLVLDIPERTGSIALADAGTEIAEWPLP